MPSTALSADGEIVVSDSSIAFRLAKVGDQFPADSRKPLATHFSLSDAETEIGQKTGRYLLSVWDLSRTSTDEARALASTSGKRLAFAVRVGEVHAIRIESDPRPLLVVRDVPAADDRLAMLGHCGILGLHRERNYRKALRDKLVEIAFPIS